jgi:two-component system chemotaxis sensor kinase CheA
VADLDAPDAVRSGDRVTHLRVRFAESDMSGVDGMLLLERLGGEFDLLGTLPEPDAVNAGAFDDVVDLFLVGVPEVVVEFAGGLGTVEAAAARPVPDATGDSGRDGDGSESEGGDGTGNGDGTGLEDEDDSAARSDEDDGAADDDGGTDRAAAGRSGEGIKSVNVDVDTLDELYGQVEQLVTSRIRLRKRIEEAGVDVGRDLDELDKTTASLQDTVMDMRLVPMRKVVGAFPRMVRDLAREQEKAVDLEMAGTDVELDRTILDRLRDPLVHVLRNAVDHGIEPPGEREAAGKPRTGTVELRARRERDRAVVEVADDGRGLDVGAIRRKAREAGLRSEAELEAMADDDVYDLVFHPGFSTTEEVTDVSGRGVGMDVVHSTVSRLDGSVDVSSAPGEGTTVRLELPVSIAIVEVLFVRVGGHEYGIPIKKIDRVVRFDGAETVGGEEFVEHEGDLVPVVRLREALDISGLVEGSAANTGGGAAHGGGVAGARSDGGRALDTPDGTARATGDPGTSGMLVQIRRNERPVALHCDAVGDQEEVVVKPLTGVLSGTEGINGTTVLGEGNVVPILDVVTV